MISWCKHAVFVVSKREQSYSVPFYSVGLNSLEMSGGNFHGYDMVMSDCEPGPARLGVDFCHVIFVTCRVRDGLKWRAKIFSSLEFLRKFAEMTSSLHAYKIQPWRLTVTLATDGARQKPVKATLTCCLKVTDLVVLLRNFYASFENGSKERVCNGTHSTAVLIYTDIAGENLSEWSS